MANCVDTLVEAMQTTALNRTRYSIARITKRPGQLPDRDDPMLPSGEFRKRSVCCRSLLRPFVSHSGTNDRSALSLPPLSLLFVPRLRYERIKKPPPGGGGFAKRLRSG